MALNIERRQRYSGQGRTYVRTETKIPINFDLASLDLMCSYVLSENRNVRKSQYINMRNLIAMLDMEKYINDQEKYKRVLFIKKGLEAHLLKELTNPIAILKYINGGILDGDVIDIHEFTSLANAEVEWVNETVSKSLSYSFIYMEADRAIELFTKFKAADYTNISTIVDEIEMFVSGLNTKFRKAKVEKATDIAFSLQDDNFKSIISEVYSEITNKYRKLKTGMQGFNKLIGGGFENTRAYLFLGLTGVGKSLTLLNLALQIKKYNKGYRPKDLTKTPCVLYLTMENSITETVQRMFQMCVGPDIDMKDYTPEEIMYMLRSSGELFLTDESPIDIIIKYKPNRSEDTGYLYTMVEDLEDEGYEVICVIQDHAKRLKAASGQQDIRLELGDVINEFKTFAMLKDIPLITVSHINRDGAKVIDGSATSTKADLTKMLGKAFIGESMLMLDNVDFGGILNLEYDQNGFKYMVFKGIKYRIAHELEYVCQPFSPENDVKLIEDFYGNPVYKETLSTVPQLNQPGINGQSKVKMNSYSSNMKEIANDEPEDSIFEAIRKEEEKMKLKVQKTEPEEKKVHIYRPIYFEEEEKSVV
ncbi:MAG: hypothetical protein PHC62_01030 [Candidatus Izemoplasmatales bacterium]|nr:hypothetical protein [Candidatus Izemoplasmatales bacterium]